MVLPSPVISFLLASVPEPRFSVALFVIPSVISKSLAAILTVPELIIIDFWVTVSLKLTVPL